MVRHRCRPSVKPGLGQISGPQSFDRYHSTGRFTLLVGGSSPVVPLQFGGAHGPCSLLHMLLLQPTTPTMQVLPPHRSSEPQCRRVLP